MAEMIHNNLPVFDDKGYDDWCVKMEAILRFQEVDEIVKKGFQEPSKGDSEEVSKAATTKEVWDILQDGYGNSSKVKKVCLQSLQRQYELLCMGEQKMVVEYIGRIQIVVTTMRACDKVVKDKKIVEKILQTLTPQYDHIMVSIEECKDLETMKVEELQNSLEAHEQRLIERKNTEKALVQGTNQALQAISNQSFKSRGVGIGRGRTRSGRTGGKSINFSD
ncbi:uncharacterized protein LOC108327333 [Vigna angularis]|uniref:uncharacterized protein LOC108327333 n=1 Tax=Phaseolus angularis TaxID=3914 RepID=UPI00080A0EAD|nr:uncharacterized protein LOC108327333 [Vigna angularis]